MTTDSTIPSAAKKQANVDRLMNRCVKQAGLFLSITGNCQQETPKEFFNRHSTRLVFRHHHELQRALASRGFLVKNVRRMEEHGVWRLSLRTGSVIDGSDPRIIRRRVSEVLNKLGHQYSARQVEVQGYRDHLKVTFIWPVGRAGWLAFTGTGWQRIKTNDT